MATTPFSYASGGLIGSASATNVTYGIQNVWPIQTYQTINWPTYTTSGNGIGNYAYPYYIYATGVTTVTNQIYTEPSEEQKKLWAEQKKKEQLAATRAEELLLMALTEEQATQYLKEGYFETIVNDKTYRIKKHETVKLIENGKQKVGFCIHPVDYNIPAQDTMLAQFLMLKSNEAEFLKVANKTVYS